MIQLNTKLQRTTGPVETTVGAEVVLMVLATGKCYGLGPTGSDIWRLLDQPTTPADVVTALAQQYDAPRAVLETDVLELLEELHGQQLIELSQP